MSGDSVTSPLLGSSSAEESSRPKSRRSNRSKHSVQSDESTPLLSRENGSNETGNERLNGRASSSAASSLRSLQSYGSQKGRRRWPTLVALSALSVLVLLIMGAGFFVPAIVEQYAKQAVVFEPTDLSVHSFTKSGIRARVQGSFRMDASRVTKKPVRDIGRFGTWIAREVETRPSIVEVSMPELDVILGSAKVPGIVVSVRNGQTTHVDFVTDLEPGQVDGIRRLANDWIEGRLGQLLVQGTAKVGLQSGIFPLGTQSITQSLVFEGHDLPSLPKFNITHLSFHEVKSKKDGKSRAMQADAVVSLHNDYPIQLAIPQLGFDILVPNCLPEDPNILLGQASTGALQIEPNSAVEVPVEGLVQNLPDVLITICPNSHSSPLDILLGEYIHGEKTTIFVRGAKSPFKDTPDWISDLLSSVVVPLPFPGHTFDNLIKNFSLTDVHFGLPNPIADPDSPEAQPRISATVKAIVALPKEMNFSLDVSRVRADADVFYKGKKLGILDLHKWQQANATRVDEQDAPTLIVQSSVQDAPLNVTDDKVYADVIQAIIFGGKDVELVVKAKVDIDAGTPLGGFVIRKIPAEGKVAVKPISGGGTDAFKPEIGDLGIISTTKESISFEAKMNFTNPTEYSASVPYVNIHILNNNTILGYAIAKDVSVKPGKNDDILIQALWDPSTLGGHNGTLIGRELLSQYISGWNTTLTLKTHNGTIPSQPMLGKALSFIDMEIPTPKLKTPRGPNHGGDGEKGDDGDDNGPHFFEDATMHLFTSTATFTLLSPLPHATIYITHINATALYNHTDPVGVILYDLPFAVPPGSIETPKLPVDWSLGSVGYEAVKSALGGTLKVDAKATVGIKIGSWSDTIWYVGKGIGAKIRL